MKAAAAVVGCAAMVVAGTGAAQPREDDGLIVFASNRTARLIPAEARFRLITPKTFEAYAPDWGG
jgi:hypothetical protein